MNAPRLNRPAIDLRPFERPRPSFAGKAAVVLVGFALIIAVAVLAGAALAPILRDACAVGCPL